MRIAFNAVLDVEDSGDLFPPVRARLAAWLTANKYSFTEPASLDAPYIIRLDIGKNETRRNEK